MDAVQFGPREDLGYRRPPVTASFEALRRQGLPEVLFVSIDLPEGVIIGEGMARIARYLAASGRNEPPDVTPQTRRRPR